MKKRLQTSLIVLFVLGVIALLQYAPLAEDLEKGLKSFQGKGVLSMVWFVGIGVGITLSFFPVSLVVSSSGFVFGWAWGFVMASGILLCGMGAGFWMGRWLWPKLSHYKIFQQKYFRAVRKAVEEEGYPLIVLLRMTPFLHFMTGNVFFGSLNLRFWPYLFYSYLGTIPGTLLLVYAGHLASSSISGEQKIEWGQTVFFVIGLLFVAGLSARITQKTRRILNRSGEKS
jgi:uncharacterized membrane protein YdjX (TVP38/TMEM64 family)